MKPNQFFLVILLLVSASCTVQQVQQTLDDYLSQGLSTEEVIAGLKQALELGVVDGTEMASRVGGYYQNPEIKIPFPPDVQKVESKLRAIGLGNEVDKFIQTLNRGAEKAAKEARPIFLEAIREMTIQDAWSILKGADDAATRYLEAKTSDQLRMKFRPVITRALESTNATKYYGDIVGTYNKIPFVEQVNPNLESYATDKALEGLFILIAEEEQKIRDNPGARTTELLRKVFQEQD